MPKAPKTHKAPATRRYQGTGEFERLHEEQMESDEPATCATPFEHPPVAARAGAEFAAIGKVSHPKVFIEFTVSDFYGTVRLWTYAEQERSIVRAEHKDDPLGPVFEVYRDAADGGFAELRHYRPLEMRAHDDEVRRLELPLVDCPESWLEGVHPADVLIDIYCHIPEEFRPDDEVDPEERAYVSAISDPLKVSPEERAQLRSKQEHIDRVFDAINSYPGGFRAEFERRKREQGPMVRIGDDEGAAPEPPPDTTK